MCKNERSPAPSRGGRASKIALLGGFEHCHPTPALPAFQQRAAALYADALALRGADRHAALSLSHHFGRMAEGRA